MAVGDTESALRLAFGSCNVPRECQQLGELPVGAMEAAAVFLELSYIPEFIKEDLLGPFGIRRRTHEQRACRISMEGQSSVPSNLCKKSGMVLPGQSAYLDLLGSPHQ